MASLKTPSPKMGCETAGFSSFFHSFHCSFIGNYVPSYYITSREIKCEIPSSKSFKPYIFNIGNWRELLQWNQSLDQKNIMKL